MDKFIPSTLYQKLFLFYLPILREKYISRQKSVESCEERKKKKLVKRSKLIIDMKKTFKNSEEEIGNKKDKFKKKRIK